MKTEKTRHQFYLPDDLSETLEALAAKPGASKTSILTDALRAWLDHKAGNDLDQRFGPRLDRQSRSTQRIEHKLETVAEMLDLFVVHQLMLVAHQPAFDQDTLRLGRQRYEQFLAQVERRLAKMRAAPVLPSKHVETEDMR